MSNFPVDTLVEKTDLCNLDQELEELFDLATTGNRVVIFGRRNTGKTSLVVNCLIPRLQTHYKKSCSVFVDLMGISSEQDVAIRLRHGIEVGLRNAFPMKQHIKSLLELAGSLRPVVSADPITSELSISLTIDAVHRPTTVSDLILSLVEIHKKIPVFLAFDEFQDIAKVHTLPALLRNALQQLPTSLSVLVCGSKKHLLAAMFGRHKAPFSGWGRDFVIPTVETDDYKKKYLLYANSRLKQVHKSLSKEAFDRLKRLCDGVPESINIVLDYLYGTETQGLLEEAEIQKAVVQVIENRRSRFEEILLRFSSVEQLILIAIAKYGPVTKPKGKDFMVKTNGLSPSAIFSNVKNLEQEADIYLTKNGYVVSDPLLSLYLQRFR